MRPPKGAAVGGFLGAQVLKPTHSRLEKEQATDDNEAYNGMGSLAYGNVTLLGDRDPEPCTSDGDGQVDQLPRGMQPRRSHRKWGPNCQRGQGEENDECGTHESRVCDEHGLARDMSSFERREFRRGHRRRHEGIGEDIERAGAWFGL